MKIGIGCLIMLAFVALGLSLGAVCFDYSLNFIFGKDIHWAGDMVCGVLLGPVNVTVAIVCFVLDVCGIEPPLFGAKPAPAPIQVPTALPQNAAIVEAS